MEAEAMLAILECPRCHGRLVKNGNEETFEGTLQRYLCKQCGYRPKERSLNMLTPLIRKRQLSVNPEGTKKLTTTTEIEVVDEISQFLNWMKSQGYRPTTIERRHRILYGLKKLGADLADPESVKAVIAGKEKWKESQKQAVVFGYDLYAKHHGIKWDRPFYKAVRDLPFIPQEREIDDLIAGVNKEIGLLLLIAKETGARAGEVYGLQWTDIDFEAKTLNIRAEKGSNPRQFKLSKKLQNVLECYPKSTERIFNRYNSLNDLRRTFERQRKALAFKLSNPRLQRIKIHTLRHWKGTTEYEKYKDLLHVKKVLGHKNIKNTELYTQLISVSEDKGWICRIANTPQEAAKLVEDSFELHVEYANDVKLFRKRKP